MNAVARQDLLPRIVIAHRQIRPDMRAEIVRPRETDLRADIHQRFRRIVVRHAAERVLALALAGNGGLQRDGAIVLQYQIHAGTSRPRPVVRVLMLEIAFRARRVLHLAGEKQPFPARRKARAQKPVN